MATEQDVSQVGAGGTALDAEVIGAGVSGIYQLYRLRGRFRRPPHRGRHQRREPGTGTAARAPLRLRELLLWLLLLARAARRVELVGALRRSGRDRGVPELRRRQARPSRPDAVPYPHRFGHVRRADRHLDTHHRGRDAASFPLRGVGHRRAVGAVLACHPGSERYRGEAYHTGQWPKEKSTSPAKGRR